MSTVPGGECRIDRFYCFPGQAQEHRPSHTRNTGSDAGPSVTASLQPGVAPLSVTLLGNSFEALSAATNGSKGSAASSASTASAESAAGGGSRGPVKLTPLCPSDHYCLRGIFELRNSQQ
jgi:hypothetical protein